MDCKNRTNYPKIIEDLRNRIRNLNASLVDELCLGEEYQDCARGLQSDLHKSLVENGRLRSRLREASHHLSLIGSLWFEELSECATDLDNFSKKLKEAHQEISQLSTHNSTLNVELRACYDTIDHLQKANMNLRSCEKRGKQDFAGVFNELLELQEQVTRDAAERSKIGACLEEERQTANFFKRKLEESQTSGHLGGLSPSGGTSWLEELQESEAVGPNGVVRDEVPAREPEQHDERFKGEAVLSPDVGSKKVLQSITKKPFKFEISGCQSYHRTSQLIVLKRSDSKKKDKKPYARPAAVVKKCYN